MDQFGVVGISYRHAGVEEVARLSLDRTSLTQRLPALRQALGVAELLYLGTCNRVELLYATGGGQPAGDLRGEVLAELTGCIPPPGQAPRLLRAWAGESAIEHVLLVACGLDSAQAGEREIAAQLRLAWESAREAGTCGPLLNRLLGEALAMANRVQRLRSGLPQRSLADLAVERVRAHLGERRERVALIGVSPMTRRCGIALVAALVLAASGGGPLLGEATLERLAGCGGRQPLAVDFGVPPNLERDVARRVRIDYVGMDDLVHAVEDQRVDELLRLAPVRAAIDARLSRLRTEMASRAIGPHLAQLREAFERIATAEAERALTAQLHTLNAAQRAAVLRLTERVAHSLVHLPICGLRAAAAHTTPEVLEAFFREAQPHRRGHPDPATPTEQASL
jgi:glutamyl-tRNA reductase